MRLWEREIFMAERYIAFDVETPNSRNNRMSAIGVTVVENGKICDDFYTLVDPEADFDYFNIMLTGITPDMVRKSPNFGEVWRELGPLLKGGVLVAHNAPFDMSVLAKCVSRYDVDWYGAPAYVCTCRMGRKIYPELPDHKLKTMCARLGVGLTHHNAGSDSRACAEILLRCMRRGANPMDFARRYDLETMKTLPFRR